MFGINYHVYRWTNPYEREQGWALSQLDSTVAFAGFLNNLSIDQAIEVCNFSNKKRLGEI